MSNAYSSTSQYLASVCAPLVGIVAGQWEPGGEYESGGLGTRAYGSRRNGRDASSRAESSLRLTRSVASFPPSCHLLSQSSAPRDLSDIPGPSLLESAPSFRHVLPDLCCETALQRPAAATPQRARALDSAQSAQDALRDDHEQWAFAVACPRTFRLLDMRVWVSWWTRTLGAQH